MGQARFFESGLGEFKAYFYERDGQITKLDNNNFMAHLHEVIDDGWQVQETEDAIYDRVCVLDETDGLYWTHWKAEHTESDWDKLEFIAKKCASILVRQFALETVKDQFRARFLKDLVDMEFVPEGWDETGQ